MWSEVEVVATEDSTSWRLGGGSRDDWRSCYQLDTLVRLSATSSVQQGPRVRSSSCSNGLILSVDTFVTALEAGCLSVLLQLEFDSHVDVAARFHEGNFLLVGVGGNLHFGDVSSKEILLTKRLLPKSTSNGDEAFVELVIEPDPVATGTYNIFLLTPTSFCWVSHLDVPKLQQGLLTGDRLMSKQCEDQMQVKFVSTREVHSVRNNHFLTMYLDGELYLILVGTGGSILSEWKVNPSLHEVSLQRSIEDIFGGVGVKKCQALDNLLFLLDDHNILSVWDAYSLIMVSYWPHMPMQDFNLFSDSESNSVENVSLKLVTLTLPDGEKPVYLQVYSFVGMELLYSLEVTSPSFLVNAPTGQDTIYFIEGNYDSFCRPPTGSASSLLLRCLTEALPENRLNRLLHKHEFEEAETFAIEFGLGVELVYKMKLNVLVEKLQRISPKCRQENFWLDSVEEAWSPLQKIQDISFIVHYCLDTCWSSFDVAVKMLQYTKTRLRNVHCGTDGGLNALMSKAQERLTTFIGAFVADNFDGPQWHSFLNSTDLFSEVLHHLSSANINRAQFIWLRHQVEIEQKFDATKLKMLLVAIPPGTLISGLRTLLKTCIIPLACFRVPGGRPILARWLEREVRNMEITEKSGWPENGLNMLEIFFNVSEFSSSGLLSPRDAFIQDDITVKQLQNLLQTLRKLLHLHRQYNCFLLLSQFENESTVAIAFRMLDRATVPQLVPGIVERYVSPYLAEHDLPKEAFFLQYIKYLLEHHSVRSTSLFETASEAKAMTVLECMSDTDLVLDAVQQIMLKAVVPWSKAMEQLVQKYLHMEHPKVKLLQESYQFMELKELLRGYGLRNLNLAVDQDTQTLVMFILKKDLASSFKDAMKVVKMYHIPPEPIYLYRMIQLVLSERGEESLELLYSLSVSMALSTGRRFVSRVMIELEYPLYLKDPTLTNNLETRETLLTRHCVQVLTFMVAHTDDHTRSELKQQLHTLDSIAKLQNNFKVFLSCSKYDDHTCRYALLTSTIGAFFTNPTNESIPAPHGNGPRHGPILCSSLEKLVYFGSLLSFEEVEVVGEIVLHAFSLGKVEMGLRLCRALPESHRGDGVARVLMSAGLTLCKMLERDELVEVSSDLNLPLEILELSRLALCFCSPDQLLECAELCDIARIAAAVYEQCQTEDLLLSDKTLGANVDQFVYETFAFEDEFKEDSIVLNASQTIPVVYEITNIIGPQLPHIGQKSPLKCSAFVGRSAGSAEEDLHRLERPINALVHSLQESSQMQLTLMVLLNYQSMLQMNFSVNMQCQSLAQKLYSNSWLTKQKDTWHSCYEKCNETTKHVTLSLIQKVLNSRVVDINLALSYCLLLPTPLAFEKLWLLVNSAQHNYRKILFIAEVGGNLAQLHQQVEQRERFLELSTDANWGLKVSKLGVSFHSVFRAVPAAKAALIPAMVTCRGLDSTMLIQFCRTFDVDCNSALKDYIETLLLRQGQDMVLSDSSTEPLITQEERARNVKDAFVVISQLENKHDLVFSLMGQLHKLSAYDYESIELVLKAITIAGLEVTNFDVEQALELLQHLYSYNRVSKVEEQEWVSQFGPLPPVADKRLPFHPLFFNTKEYFWKFIGKELTVQTLPTLKLITSLMKMSLNKLYMSAVKHVFQNSLKLKMIQQPTVMTLSNSGSLRIKKDILAIIKQIQSYIMNIDQHEYANAAANYVVQNLSPGPVKVHAMWLWVRLAQQWMLSLPQGEDQKSAETSLQKIKTECLRAATESALLQHSLHQPDFVKLIGRPARLLFKLYEHASITERFLQPLGHGYPDIHALATEIAEINKTDLDKIKMMMQQTLLTENQQTTFHEVQITSQNLLWDIPEENMARLIYLLQALPPDDGAHYLFTVADLTFSDVSVTYGQRARALRCLLRIADSKTIEKVTLKSVEQLWCYLKSCVYLSKLESLNIPYTFKAFQSSPKEGIIKGLWKNHNQEPHAVQLVAQMSLDYAISDANLWAGVLQKLFTYGLLNQLGEVLVKLNSFSCLWQIPNLARMWTAVILTPLMEMLSPTSPEQEKACRQSFLLLLRCPVLADLDILAFGKRFALAGRPSLAVASLLLVPVGSDRRKHIQDLLNNCCLETLLSQATEDVREGDFSVLAKQVIKMALEHMVETGETRIKAAHLPLIKDFVFGQQRIRGLLEHLIESGWETELLRLIAEHLKHSGESVPQGVSPSELLKRFVDKSENTP